MGAAAAGAYVMKIWKKRQMKVLHNRTDYFSDQFQLLNHWLEIKNEGKSAASYFTDMGYHHIAIYGMAELANRLFEDLEGSPVIIDYGIDRDVCCSIGRIESIFSPDENFPNTEVIVVTPYHSFNSIKSMLEKKVNCSQSVSSQPCMASIRKL